MESITSVSDLLTYTSGTYFTEERGRWVFRGHSDINFKLIPSVGRGTPTSVDREKYEKSLFDIFCREVRPYLSTLPRDDWEWLSIAQHHGLPTRLLDWTYNPLVALYFAVEKNYEADGALFALRATKKASSQAREDSPFQLQRSVKLYPNVVTPRIRAQEGLFVACSKLEMPLDISLILLCYK